MLMNFLGNPCEDLARLLSANASGKYRRENTNRLLRYYQDKVEGYLGYSLFTFDQVNISLDHSAV